MSAPQLTLSFFAFTLFCLSTLTAQAQADATAIRSVDMTVFGGITGVYTGLSGGKNTAVTAGLDLNLPSIARFRPALEVRASSPIARGTIDNQKYILAGPRVEYFAGRFHPYVDFLAGRGQITYTRPYVLLSGAFLYNQARSTVLSPGAGVRIDLIGNFSVLADAQFQRWDTPASLSGHLFAKPFTAGIVYRFTTFGHYPKR